jgi:hypothetical protein
MPDVACFVPIRFGPAEVGPVAFFLGTILSFRLSIASHDKHIDCPLINKPILAPQRSQVFINQPPAFASHIRCKRDAV